MSLTSSCMAICAPLTAVASVLLFMMSYMLRSGNWTFEVLAAKHGWETAEKASVCQRGAVLYLFTSFALWVGLLLQAPLQRLWMRMPWSQSQGYAEEQRMREGLLAPTTSGRSVRSGSGSDGYRHGVSDRAGPATDEAVEMSALEWGQEGMRPSTYVKANALPGVGSNPLMGNGLDRMKNTITTAAAGGASTSLNTRRFPDFLRSLADAAAAAGTTTTAASLVNSAARGLTEGKDGTAVSAATAAATTWGRARGLRSRASQSGAALTPQGIVTIKPDFAPAAAPPAVLSVPALLSSRQQQQQLLSNANSNVWSGSGGEPDSVDDSEFLSDVELDSTRHHSLLQIRASGWGMHQRASVTAAGAVSSAAPTRRHRGRVGDGASSTLQSDPQLRSQNTLQRSTTGRGGNGGGCGGASAGAQEAAMITTLWSAAASSTSPSSSSASYTRGGRPRGTPSGGPPPAMQW
jgi:hypothetical protein